jgi:hypothetical protein
MVPLEAGSGADVGMREFCRRLGTALGQPVVVVNKPGAGSSIGYRAVRDSKPDGYTIYGKQIHGVREVHWVDLGLPEAIWVLEMKDFGPLLVTMDSWGRSFYDELRVEENLHKIYIEKGMIRRGTCRRGRLHSVISSQ